MTFLWGGSSPVLFAINPADRGSAVHDAKLSRKAKEKLGRALEQKHTEAEPKLKRGSSAAALDRSEKTGNKHPEGIT